MKFQNASATQFHLDVAREVRLLGVGDLGKLLGDCDGPETGRQGRQAGRLRNDQPADQSRRADESRKRARIDVDSGDAELRSAVGGDRAVQAWRPGRVGSGGQVGLFRPGPAERLKVFARRRAASVRTAITARRSAYRSTGTNVLGSIDFQSGVLALVHFTMPEDPTKGAVHEQHVGGPARNPYTGDVVNSYNDGPPAPARALGRSTRSSRSRRPRPCGPASRWSTATARFTSRPIRPRSSNWPGRSSAWSWTPSGKRCWEGSDASGVPQRGSSSLSPGRCPGKRVNQFSFVGPTGQQFTMKLAYSSNAYRETSRSRRRLRGSPGWATRAGTAGRRAARLAGRIVPERQAGDPRVPRSAWAGDFQRQRLHDERRGRSAAALLASLLDRARPALPGHPPRAHQAGARAGQGIGGRLDPNRAGRAAGRRASPGTPPPMSSTTRSCPASSWPSGSACSC